MGIKALSGPRKRGKVDRLSKHPTCIKQERERGGKVQGEGEKFEMCMCVCICYRNNHDGWKDRGDTT